MTIFVSFTFWNHYDCSTCIYTHGRLCKQWVDGPPNTTLPQLWQSLCHVSNSDGSLREPVELETTRDVTPAARGHAAAAAHQPDGGTGEAAWSSRCQSPRWPGGKCCRQQPPPAWLCVDRSASVWTRCLFCPVLLIWTLFKTTTTTNKIKQNKILCEFTDRCRFLLWNTHTAGSLFLLFAILITNPVFQTTLTHPASSGNGRMLRFYWSSGWHVIHVPATHWSIFPMTSCFFSPRTPSSSYWSSDFFVVSCVHLWKLYKFVSRGMSWNYK